MLKASGNSDPALCVEILIKTVRGEVPYERIKGISRELIDAPSGTAESEMLSDIQWNIETYEPRVDVDDIDIDALAAENGAFKYKPTVTMTGGD